MTRDRQTVVWTGALVVFVALLFLLSEVLMPFVAGMAVAYFLDPLADRLEKWGASRTLATSLILAAFFFAVVIVLGLLFPLLQAQVVDFAHRVPGYIEVLRAHAAPLIEKLMASLTPEQEEKMREAVGSQAGTAFQWLTNILTNLWGGGLAVFNILSLVFLTPLVTFYLLRDWDRIVERLDTWLPRDAAPTVRARMVEIDQTLAGFVRGQATVCLILAAFYAIGLTLAGLDFGLLVGLGAGIISFIPFVGALVGLVTGLGLALAQFSEWTPIVIVAVIFAVGQVLEGNFLTPKLVGERVGLHPVWVIFALLVGGSLFGFTGVLLAVPAAAVIGVLVRFSHDRYMQSDLYRGSAGPDSTSPEAGAPSTDDPAGDAE